MMRQMSSEYMSKENQNNTNGVKSDNLAIAWIDLKITGQNFPFQKKKTILNEISGYIDFGSLNALMGPSGAGKSTLLKCINGRNSGDVERNSDVYLSSQRNIRSCFIVQDISEHLLKGLTAMQSLIYASKLKNCDEDIECDYKLNARKLLKDLMISDIEDTPVERCSGGEQKRIVIALELTAIRKPNLLCIDEPTSGLDSNAAEIVIKCLRDVSRKHTIGIVTSIHQPNNDVLMLFDKLYVLAKGGHCVFEGPPQHLREHIIKAEIECNENQIPIEVLLKTASTYDESVERLVKLNFETKTDLRTKCISYGRLSPKGIKHKSLVFSLNRFWHLFRRTITYSFRSQWKAMSAQFIFIVGLSFIVIKLFNKHIGEIDGCFTFERQTNASCHKTVEALREEGLLGQNVKFQFMATILLQWLITMATTLTFASEVRIFFTEHTNGWYSTGSYYWAKSMVELPLCLSTTICYVFVVYKGNHQIEEDFRFLGYMLVVCAGAVCSQGLGFTVGIISNSNDKLAVILSMAVYLIEIFLCGFFAPIDELPEAIKWITHFSYVKQTYEMVLYLLYGFERCPKGYISSVLYQTNLTDENKFWTNSIILGIHLVLYRILALLVLLIKANPIKLHVPGRAKNKSKKLIEEPIEIITHL